MINRYALILFITLMSLISCSKENKMCGRYLIPASYQGPLVVIYNQEGYPILPQIDGEVIFDFMDSNIIRTSSNKLLNGGPIQCLKYYYVAADGKKDVIKVAVSGGLVPLRELSYYDEDSLGTQMISTVNLKHNIIMLDEPFVFTRFSRIGESYVSDIVSTPNKLKENLEAQRNLADSLFARRR